MCIIMEARLVLHKTNQVQEEEENTNIQETYRI